MKHRSLRPTLTRAETDDVVDNRRMLSVKWNSILKKMSIVGSVIVPSFCSFSFPLMELESTSRFASYWGLYLSVMEKEGAPESE